VAVALYRRAAVRRAAVDRYRTAKFVLWPMLGQTGGRAPYRFIDSAALLPQTGDLITAKK